MKNNLSKIGVLLLIISTVYSQNLPGWFMNPLNPPDRIVVTGTSFSPTEENAANTALEDARTKISKKVSEYVSKELSQTLTQPELFGILDFVRTLKTASIRDRNVYQAFVMIEISKKDIHTFLQNPLKSKSAHVRPAKSVKPSVPKQSGYFLHENFDSVQEGMIPQNWFGGEKLIVKSERGKKYLTDFAKIKKHVLTIPGLNIPENFEISYIVQFGGDKRDTHIFFYLGNVTTVIDVLGWCKLNDSRDNRKQDFRNTVIKVTLQKIGPVFKLYINGEERIISRINTYKPADTIRLEFQNMTNFKLLDIVGRAI